MSVALPLTTLIGQGATKKRMNRVLSAQFGDGYSQETPDGINNTIDEWSITYENITAFERTVLIAALDSVGSWDDLTWTPPGDTFKRFKVTRDGYTETPASGDLWTISFNLKQVYL